MKTMKYLCIANEGILMNLGSKFQGALLLHIRMSLSLQSIEGSPLISIASIENFERMTPYHTDPYRTLLQVLQCIKSRVRVCCLHRKRSRVPF